jgi:hypothetical protein
MLRLYVPRHSGEGRNPERAQRAAPLRKPPLVGTAHPTIYGARLFIPVILSKAKNLVHLELPLTPSLIKEGERGEADGGVRKSCHYPSQYWEG